MAVSPCTLDRHAWTGSARVFIHPLSLCSTHFCTISYMYVIFVKGKTGICQLAPRECILTDPGCICDFIVLYLVH